MQHLNIDTLIDYQRGELAPGDDAAVLAHLEACAVCTREFNAESALVERLRTEARAAELELPLGMRSAIMARIAASAPTPFERIAAWLRPIVVVPVLAAVAAAAFFLFPMTQHQAAPPAAMPVSYYLEEHAAHAQENPIADRSAAVMMTTSSTAATPALPLIEAASMTLADDGAR